MILCSTGAVTLTCDMATRAPVKYRVAFPDKMRLMVVFI